MASTVFLELIAIGREDRNLEYKHSTSWDDKAFRAKVTKSILAMSNLRDGGHIIIGIEQQGDGSYSPKGMEQPHIDSFIFDDVARFVAEYADPYARFNLTKEKGEKGRQYVWIQVGEFEEIPVICRKSYSDILSAGKVYTRTRRVPESAEVPGHTEMREILDMATEKGIKTFIQRASQAGVQLTISPVQIAEQPFEEQLRGIF